MTRYNGIEDANPPSVRCFNYIEGFKYMAGDFVCDDSLIWTPATDENNLIVEASWIRPSEMTIESIRWESVNGKLAVDPAPTSNTLTPCFDWRYST